MKMRINTCPECEAEVEHLPDNGELVTCGECNTLLRINYDAEFVDGRWVDRTTLHKFRGT